MDALRDVLESASLHVPKYTAPLGLSREVILRIATAKNEPEWMTEKRMRALEYLIETSMPNFGPSLDGLDLESISYFVQPDTKEHRTWDDVPDEIRSTFEKLGIPES